MAMTRNLLMAAGVALGVSFAGAASAQPYLSPGVQNTISDDYGERVWDVDGSGTVTAGDVFLGVIGMTGSAPATYLNNTGQLPQVTGLFATTVQSVAGGSVTMAPSTSAQLAGAAAALGLDAATQAFIAALPNQSVNGLTGAVAWLYEGNVADFFPIGGKTFQQGVTAATDGSLVLVAGLNGSSPFESLTALANSTVLPGNTGLVGLFGTFGFAMSVLQENWPDIIGFGILPLTGTQLYLSGNINSCDAVHANTCGADRYQYASDATATFIPIPEPATIALFGAGLFGLAGILRRRREQV